MPITSEQLRMARAALKMTMRDLADRAEIDKGTLVRIEAGYGAHPFTLRQLQSVLEAAGIEFIDPIEGVRSGGVALKWGVQIGPKSQRSVRSEEEPDTALEALAWDDEFEDVQAVSPEIEELRSYWRERPEEWAALHASSRFALLREMRLRRL
jgi:transcriptional regulator with XRE-family HTH domain